MFHENEAEPRLSFMRLETEAEHFLSPLSLFRGIASFINSLVLDIPCLSSTPSPGRKSEKLLSRGRPVKLFAIDVLYHTSGTASTTLYM